MVCWKVFAGIDTDIFYFIAETADVVFGLDGQRYIFCYFMGGVCGVEKEREDAGFDFGVCFVVPFVAEVEG